MNPTRIASLLASGLKPAQVATIIGVTPARISQLVSEESFQLLLADKRVEFEKEDMEELTLSTKYAATEHLLINQIMEKAPSAELRDITAALRTISERQDRAKQRLIPPNNNNGNNNNGNSLTVISISLPNHAVPSTPVINISKQGEVIAIGEQTLAPLASTAVTNLFSKMRGEQNEPSTSIASTKEILAETVPSSYKEIEGIKEIEEEEKTGFLSYAAAY